MGLGRVRKYRRRRLYSGSSKAQQMYYAMKSKKEDAILWDGKCPNCKDAIVLLRESVSLKNSTRRDKYECTKCKSLFWLEPGVSMIVKKKERVANEL